jgi:hypothetical protein
MTRVIGLTGLKRSGKNTVAKIIAEQNDDLFVREASLAAPLKIAGAKLLGVEGDTASLLKFADDFKEHGRITWDCEGLLPGEMSGREFYQRIGTEAGRDIHGEDVRIAMLVNSYFADPCDIFVVTDVRFDNEAIALRESKMQAEIWQVHRPGLISDGHSSEDGVSENLITHFIDNSGTLDDLREEVRVWL